MRKHLIQFLLVAVLLVFTSAAWAQTTVHGQLVDAETGEPLVGAAVMVEGTMGHRTKRILRIERKEYQTY